MIVLDFRHELVKLLTSKAHGHVIAKQAGHRRVQGSLLLSSVEFLTGKTLTANQIEFVNMIIDHVSQRGWLDPSSLCESPFADFSPRGIEGLFNPA
ncbi:MAG: type I restriction-modification enzyme R subunit C-terminal domain-containing protein [Candidatus Acidiferrales bacterium]